MMETKFVVVGYFNVRFFLLLEDEIDEMKFQYLAGRITNGEKLHMKDIDGWCKAQGIEYKSKFKYRKDMPILANIWNFYSYIRFCLTHK